MKKNGLMMFKAEACKMEIVWPQAHQNRTVITVSFPLKVTADIITTLMARADMI